MASGFKAVVGAFVAGSLFLTSTTAVAAVSSAPVTAVAPAQISPWAALTAMSGGASAAALCGAAAVAAAAQAPGGCVLPALDVPPPVVQSTPPPQPIPVPPIESAGGLGLGIDPLLLALGVLAAGALVYFLVRNNNNNDEPNSPA